VFATATPPARRGAWVPTLSAVIAGVIAVGSLVSALTPNLAARAHDIPFPDSDLFHSLTVPASAALLTTAIFLAKRRRRACTLAVALLATLGALHVLKGFDVEEAVVSWSAAALLWWGRPAFVAAPARVSWRAAGAFAAALLAGAAALAFVASWAILGGRPGAGLVAREALDLLLWHAPPAPLSGDELRLIPLGVRIASLGAAVIAAAALFRPHRPPRALPGPEARRAAMHLVRTHGSDTLAFFKLRLDKHYLFSPDGRAFLGYRTVGGALLVSGDPIGPADAIPALLERTVELADRHGLSLGVVGAGEEMLDAWRAAGLRTVYLGDEAIVDTAKLSLEGRAVRKIRQSVNRLLKAGYTTTLIAHEDLSTAELAELEEVSGAWLDGEPERGFSMAMEGLRGPHHAGSVMLVARGPDGRVDGFLHFVPAHGRPAMSLGFMRRRHDTPNGLTEFLVVRAIEGLRERGIEEVSLNFCAFGRWLREPETFMQRMVGRIVPPFDRLFQIQSLLRFNAKFATRWSPRHVAFRGWTSLPRFMLAALEAEGQLPKPSMPTALRRAA
jgi:lysyl-tRNA synthetase, class II